MDILKPAVGKWTYRHRRYNGLLNKVFWDVPKSGDAIVDWRRGRTPPPRPEALESVTTALRSHAGRE
jgi:hypothetical protein